MNAALEQKSTSPAAQKPFPEEPKLVLFLCVLAAIHVFIFSAAFPTFNVNDEAAHYDLVLKYSHGNIPRDMSMMSDEWLRYYALFGSPEYFFTPESLGGSEFPAPLWTHPVEEVKSLLPAYEQGRRVHNHESSQPPLYYLVAAAWWRLGQGIGFHDGSLLYWLRFLNVFLVAALVWLGHVAARIAFPGRPFLSIGVPALLAFLPQTVFYSVTNDILSPLCIGLAFISLLRWWEADPPQARHGILLGASLAATFLTKISNLPTLGVVGLFLLWDLRRLAKAGKLRAAWVSWLCLVLCAGLPAAWWMFRCRHNFGDFTGSAGKIQLLGWTHKPVAEWFHHPLFTPRGLWIFCHDLLASLWRGEFWWRHKPLASSAVDMVYVLISLGMMAAALVNLCRKNAKLTGTERRTLWLCFCTVLASVMFLGFLSLIYDFHACFYPSREYPYFTSGRLMLGVVIPFLLLCLYGLEGVLQRATHRRVWPLALAGLMLFMLVAETAVDWTVFSSGFNWFHLP